jgi:ATP-binding cassette subfamily C protein CydD
MLTPISAFDQASAKKASAYLKALSALWRKDILTISVFRIAAFVAFNIQLITIAGLISNIALKDLHAKNNIHLILLICMCGIARAGFNYVSDMMAAKFSRKVTVKLRSDMLHELRNGYLSLFKRQSPGSLSLSLINKTEAIAPYFTRYQPQMILCAVTPVMVLAYVATINWVCALLVLFTAPAIPLFMMIIGKGTEAKSKERLESLSKMGAYFFDRLQGITTLYLYGQLKKQSEQVLIHSKSYARQVMEVLRIAFLSSAVIEFLSAVIIAGCAVFIGLNMLHYINYGPSAGASLRNGLIVLLLIPEFFTALKALGNFYHDRAQAIGAVISLQKSCFFTGSTIGPPQNNHHVVTRFNGLDDIGGFPALQPPSIILRSIDFSYPGGPKLFKSFNLEIKPYEKVRISGLNGSGKTTLIALILGWEKPDSGELFLGGHSMERISEKTLFSEISLINQQTTIFQGTIRTNILMGAVLTDEYLWANIIEPASLVDFLENLPLGLDTPVAEDGKSISGGERQKIALARALVRKSRIIILDEPLAHLDAESATTFISALEHIGKNKTIVMTGHGESYQGINEYREIRLTQNAYEPTCVLQEIK